MLHGDIIATVGQLIAVWAMPALDQIDKGRAFESGLPEPPGTTAQPQH